MRHDERCPAVASNGRRCERRAGHRGNHEITTPAGSHAPFIAQGVIVDVEHPAGATFDELLEHLEDLAALAESERFSRLGMALRDIRELIARDREWIAVQIPPTPAPTT